MDTSILKEPRGFMRCLEILFSIAAFASCAGYNSYSQYGVKCSNGSFTRDVRHEFSYPFRLDHSSAANVTCDGSKYFSMYPPGDLASDSQFFVFTGVVSSFGAIASLLVYLFFSEMYLDEQKKAPTVDFCCTVVIAVFWLSASAAWANGLSILKYVADPVNWIFSSNNSICLKQEGIYVVTTVRECQSMFTGSFGGANGSVILGFLNFFLWAANLWFIFKETSWFTSRSQTSQAQPLP